MKDFLSGTLSNVFARFKISHKLWAATAFMLVILGVVSGTAVFNFSNIKGKVSEMVDVSQPLMLKVIELESRIDAASVALGFYLLSSEQRDQQAYENALISVNKILKELKAMPQVTGNPQVKERVSRIALRVDKFAAYKDKMIPLGKSFALNQPALTFAAEKMNPYARTILNNLTQMLNSEEEEELTEERRTVMFEVARLRQTWMNLIISNRGFMAMRGKNEKANLDLYAVGFKEEFDKFVKDFGSMLNFDEETAVEELQETIPLYLEAMQELIKIHGGEKWRTDSYLMRTEIGPLVAEIRKDIEVLVTTQRKAVESGSQDILSSVVAASGIVLTLLVIGVVLGFVGAWIVSRMIVNPINETVEAMHEIAAGEGDLTKRLQVKGNDEIADLSRGFNEIIDLVHNTIRNITDASGQLAAAAEQLSATSYSANENVVKEKHQLDQVATAMTEMASTAQEVAHNADSAATGTQQADQQAAEGRAIVSDTMSAINNLASEVESASSTIKQLEADTEQIGTVVEVIQGIAEQTNLLALNAAIEAARAGEQGRGFAVVADEVRSLATRTQQSTQEIQDMIERLQKGAQNAVSAMDSGREQATATVDKAAQADVSLNQISSSITEVSSMNMQIAEAVRQQGMVTEEVNTNIVTLSDVARETESGSQQISSASEELSNLAYQLQNIIGKFKV